MAHGLGSNVALTDRLRHHVLASEVPLERSALVPALRDLAPVEAPLATDHDIERVIDDLIGLGPLEPLLREPEVSDVLVNGPSDVWVERSGRLERTDVRFADAADLQAAVERIIGPLGLRLDRSSPAVDARLADGSRLHAVIPPIAPDGPLVAVRRFTQAVPDLEAFVQAGSISEEGATVLVDAVEQRKNILVAGPTGSGKTTLLNVLSAYVAPGERVVTIEDAIELDLTGHVVRLESRPPNQEGAGEVTLSDLVRHALRLRPDRLIVGEVRGLEAFDLIQALATGHRGSFSTIHASNPREALFRLASLARSRGGEHVVARARDSFDMVVQLERRDGLRIVVSIVNVDGESLQAVYAC